jgi:hypothetical protein
MDDARSRGQGWPKATRRGVKCFSFAFFGLPIGLTALIGGATSGVTGVTVLGSVVVCLVLSALVADTRLKHRDEADRFPSAETY